MEHLMIHQMRRSVVIVALGAFPRSVFPLLIMATNQPNQRVIATNRPEFVTISGYVGPSKGLGLRTLKGAFRALADPEMYNYIKAIGQPGALLRDLSSGFRLDPRPQGLTIFHLIQGGRSESLLPCQPVPPKSRG